MKKASKKKAAKKAKAATAKKKAATPKKKAKAKSMGKKAAKKVAKKKSGKPGKKKSPVKKAAVKRAAKKAVKKAAKKKAAVKKAPPPALPPGARAAPLPAPSITPAAPADVLLSLARLLHDKPQFHDEIRLAVESPEGYLADFAADLELRGIDDVIPSLPWIALTDGLARHGALVYLDWKFEPDDLSDALDKLLGARRDRVDLTALAGYSDSAEALEAAGDRLAEHGLALITVDNADVEDAYPVAIIDADDVEEAQRLAAALGLGSIESWESEAD